MRYDLYFEAPARVCVGKGTKARETGEAAKAARTSTGRHRWNSIRNFNGSLAIQSAIVGPPATKLKV